MLTIRLQRTGKRNQADFRIVLAEKEAPVKKKHLEVLGSYNPRRKNFKLNEERTKYWIAQRVQLSPTVHNLFVTKGLVDGSKVKAFSIPKKPPEPAAAQEVKSESIALPPSIETPAPDAPAAESEESEKSEKLDKAEEAVKAE